MSRTPPARSPRLARLALLASLVAGCGGGGGSDPAASPAPVPPPPSVPSTCRYQAPTLTTTPASVTPPVFEDQFLTTLARPTWYRAYMAPIDVDGDGQPEMVIAETGYPGSDPYGAKVQIARRTAGGWIDDTAALLSGTAVPDHVRDMEIADFNGDGRPDVLFNGHGYDASPFPGARNQLLLSGGNRLTVSNERLGATRNSFTHSSAHADIDCDGKVDLYEGNAFWGASRGSLAEPRLLRGDGTGGFSDVSTRLPSYVTDYSRRYLSAEFCDVDNDGAPDLFLGGFDNASELLLNDGHGRFARSSGTTLPADAFPTTRIQAIEARCVDIDQDGWKDIVQLQLDKPFADAAGPVQRRQLVWRNTGQGRFVDVTATWMPALRNTGFMTVLRVLDVNRDGWPDLLLASGENGEDQGLLINAGNRFVFSRVGDGSYAAPHMEMDVDGDGKLDLVELTDTVRVRRQR